VIVGLWERGYDDRIVMSHGHAAYLDWLHVSATHTTEAGAESYAHVSEWAMPDVRARGVREQDITQITVGTPACILASIGHGGY
jgi:predicted metal-dependent phosphotriesterase family hydrolase